jgi:preprotein translocase subunit YajC
MLPGNAPALVAESSGSGSGLVYLVILVLPLLLLGWLFLTQRKRAQQAQQMQAALAVGDEVVTTSGLFGTIVALDESAVTLDAGSGTLLRYDRRAIGGKTTEVV